MALPSKTVLERAAVADQLAADPNPFLLGLQVTSQL